MTEQGKRLFITGGCGFIGSNLVRSCLASGYHVINLDKLTYAGNRSSLADIEDSPGYNFRHGDIGDQELVRAVFREYRPHSVLNLAAESHVDRSIDSPREFIQTNIVGTFNVLAAAQEYFNSLDTVWKERFRFLHISTDEVFGSLGPEGYFAESTPYDPHSPYAASKAASDHLVRSFKYTYGLPVLVTNCSNNYGPYQFPEKLIPLVINSAIRGQTIPVYGDGCNVRDWLYVKDHCEAIRLVLEKGTPGETYNIGGNAERTNIEIVMTICGILDELNPAKNGERYEQQIRYVPDRPGHDRRYAIDATKIREEIGWAPSKPFDSGIRETIEWYLDNQDWVEDILSGKYRMERLGVRKGAI